MSKSIAIVGSGLAAVAACKALVRRGIKPVVLDVGYEMPEQCKNTSQRMSQLKSVNWSLNDKKFVTRNYSIEDGQAPKKLLFGSDYFYSNPEEAFISCDNPEVDCPPFSLAKGGFSVGWGASVLFPDEKDLLDWPITASELYPHFQRVLEDLPYSAKDDDLSLNFPLIKHTQAILKPNSGNLILLDLLKKSKLLKKNSLVYGQSRSLVDASICQYCGICLSGCVYDAIYKSNHDLNKLIQSNLIDYQSGIKVDAIEDSKEGSTVFYKDAKGNLARQSFSRVLLAAGAVNSTAIIMKSKKLYDTPVSIKTTLGFIAPMFRFKPLTTDWPNSNTLSGVFLEFKAKELSKHWVHTQLSTPNELVLSKLGVGVDSNQYLNSVKKRASQHIVIAHCNIHSVHANHYNLVLKNNEGNNCFKAQREQPALAVQAINTVINKLANISRSFGCYVIKPLVKNSTQSHGYHLGASMPMKLNPENELDTDTLGRPLGWKKTHVIDSSIFPSLPATTVGVLSMANATRIVGEMEI
jgi:hypothetical protein